MTTLISAPITGASYFSPRTHSSSYQNLSSLGSSSSYDGKDSNTRNYHTNYEAAYPTSAQSSAPSSPQLVHTVLSRRDSCLSTPASSVSLENPETMDGDDDMAFPSYENSGIYTKPSSEPQQSISEEEQSRISSPPSEDTPDLPETVNDDQAIEPEPSRHVDYLSHEWKEEEIWSSWSYVVHRRKTINNSVRLENASWRSWMKAKNNLKTISPETLNWLKDCDVTWLYGPLQTETRKSITMTPSLPPSRLSHSSSFISKKPILKKKSASAAILERSRSQHSLLQRASEIIRVQQSSPAHGRPNFRRGNSEFALNRYTGSSVANTPAEHDLASFSGTRSSFIYSDVPTPSECKHVLFDEEVRQVQAVDSEEDDKEEDMDAVIYDDDEDDDGGLMMAPASRSSRSGSRGTPRGSFSNESKTIVPLPSTTLKYRTDTPEPAEPPKPSGGGWFTGHRLSPSPSQETLRPPRPNHNFLIDDDPDVVDEPWPSNNKSRSYTSYSDDAPGPNMRRTESGMFMPYDENDEDEAAMNNTIFGQAMYAVNTVKDIAHVVWNVGWHRR